MKRGAGARPPVGAGVDLVGPLLLLPPGLLLAYLSSLGLGAGIALAVAGALGFYAVALVPWARAHALPGWVAVGTLGVLAVTVPPVPVAGLAAGVAAVSVLLALGRSTARPDHRGRALAAVGLPFVGFLVAFAAAIVLPVTRQFVGVATLLAIGAVAALALVYAAPDRVDAIESESS